MKIMECIDQLHKDVKLYNKIINDHNKICDILPRLNVQDLINSVDIGIYTNYTKTDIENIDSIFTYIKSMHDSMPLEFKNKNDKYFDNIDFSFLNDIKLELEKCIDTLEIFSFTDNISRIKSIINRINEIDKLDGINRVNHCLTKILLHIPNLKLTITAPLYCNIFNAGMRYRNAMIKYVNNLELPTITDWEFDEKRNKIVY